MKLWSLRKQRPLILEMLVAVCLAFLIWLYAHSRAQETLDNALIPVTLQMESGQQNAYELDIQGPRQITVSFSGFSARIREVRRMLQRGQIKAIVPCSVPPEHLKDSRFSEKLMIEPGHIAVPPGVSLVMAEGTMLEATFHRIVERQLPVHLEHPDDVHVRQPQLDPAMVTVRGPQDILDRVHYIPTQPYSFTVDPDAAIQDSVVQGQVDLVTELDRRPIQTNPERVSFKCRVQPKQRIYELIDVPVLFLCPPEFPWRATFGTTDPSKVNLRIMGPPGDEPPPVQVYIDLSKGNFARGKNREPIHVQMPRDFQLAPQSPQLLTFYLEDLCQLPVEQ